MLENRSYYDAVEDFERKLICQALEQTNGHQAQAARILRLTPTTLSDKIRRLGINARAFKQPKGVSYGTFEKMWLWKSHRP